MNDVQANVMKRIAASAMVITPQDALDLKLEVHYILYATEHFRGYKLYQDADDNWYRVNIPPHQMV